MALSRAKEKKNTKCIQSKLEILRGKINGNTKGKK